MTPDELRELISYDPATGALHWRVYRCPPIPAGTPVAPPRPGRRRRSVEIADRSYEVNWLAWVLHHGTVPNGTVWNLDGDLDNTRIGNLTVLPAAPEMLTAERLRLLLSYDEATGVFTWRIPRGSMFGSAALCRRPDGYTVIRVDNKLYRAHRLAWLYVHGRWPAELIDHINGDRSDNRIGNLREASHKDNNGNAHTPRHNTSGYRGVQWSKKHRMWLAVIHKNNRPVFLGHFDSPEAAHAAYMEAAHDHFGDFAPTPSQARAKT